MTGQDYSLDAIFESFDPISVLFLTSRKAAPLVIVLNGVSYGGVLQPTYRHYGMLVGEGISRDEIEKHSLFIYRWIDALEAPRWSRRLVPLYKPFHDHADAREDKALLSCEVFHVKRRHKIKVVTRRGGYNYMTESELLPFRLRVRYKIWNKKSGSVRVNGTWAKFHEMADRMRK